MNNFSRMRGFTEILKIVLILVTGVLVIPLLIGFYHHIAMAEILGLVVSLLILQPVAVVVGLGLGISPIPLLLIMCSFGLVYHIRTVWHL